MWVCGIELEGAWSFKAGMARASSATHGPMTQWATAGLPWALAPTAQPADRRPSPTDHHSCGKNQLDSITTTDLCTRVRRSPGIRGDNWRGSCVRVRPLDSRERLEQSLAHTYRHRGGPAAPGVRTMTEWCAKTTGRCVTLQPRCRGLSARHDAAAALTDHYEDIVTTGVHRLNFQALRSSVVTAR